MMPTPASDWHNLLYRKLKAVSLLIPRDFANVNKLAPQRSKLAHREEIAGSTGTMAVVASGWIFRYRTLLDGRRVVFNFHLPGDLINLSPMYPGLAYNTAAWGPAELVLISHTDFRELCEVSPPLVSAIAAGERLDALLLANQVLRLGRLTAYERLVHFLLEHWERSKLVGLTDNRHFHMPLTQDVLGDALGLTNFHVSRTLTRLRADKLVQVDHDRIELNEIDHLMAVSEYDSIDLQLAKNRL